MEPRNDHERDMCVENIALRRINAALLEALEATLCHLELQSDPRSDDVEWHARAAIAQAKGDK